MYNAVEFARVEHQATEADEWITGTVFIVPDHVVKVEPYERRSGQGLDTRITLIEGEPELVIGPPSEVNARLRRGQ